MTHLTVASLNTRGTPLRGLAHRYTTIATTFESSGADVVNLQKVLTYVHLHLLRHSMPSYHANFRPSAAGPAGGLVTFTRSQGSVTYQRLPASRLPRGVLRTRLPSLTVLNTHLLANRDGDWSPTNRFHAIHQAQLAALSRYAAAEPAVLTGDFNVPRDSALYRDFLCDSQLVDAFDDCPPTFHQAYLPPGRSPQCIDYVLLSGSAVVESAELDGGYPSDHLCLRVSLRF
ncbi:endonuclease/exonuclease/phosphatase family protein [Kribbella sp.]|uniref:endonuclease/exonuclease/phosphatase family protein n=1 Tax=Kribbella sp. TaxID=1871183 RepID=UPI002D6BF78C|nr:endonuclease/exonuclease/phosphatase family protein [Kribbella sp.]HZX03706.1 endonuclease/exonuclease/phosphatase family protein [Kribbella sp.]